MLAIIHRDGDHYVEKYGLEKAIQDARTGIQAFQADAWEEGLEYGSKHYADKNANPYLNQQPNEQKNSLSQKTN